MWVRKISRTWKGRGGNQVVKDYYYWYKSIRKGTKVISQCVRPATKEEYVEYISNSRQNVSSEAVKVD